MNYTEYITNYSSGNKISHLNNTQLLRLMKIVEVESRIDQIKRDNNLARYSSGTPGDIPKLKELLFEITKMATPAALLREMQELSKEK